MLQSYISRERDRISLAPSRPASVIAYSAPGTIRSIRTETMTRPKLQMNGQSTASPVLVSNELGRIPTQSVAPSTNGIIKGEVYVERPPSLYDERPIDVTNLEIAQDRRGYASDSNVQGPVSQMELLQQEIKRSASSASRQNWKDHMRRKHLPPIFVNEGYEPGDKSPSTEQMKVQAAFKEGVALREGGLPLNYYMSSDYHPDCLTDSLPRNRIKQALSTESEGGEVYRNEDIDEVLNTPTFYRHIPNTGMLPHCTSSFRTFKRSPEMPRINIQRGVYSTFDDLSKMDMRQDNEIEFDNESIPLDELSDTEPYNGPVTLMTNSKGVHKINYAAIPERSFSSFKPDDSSLRHTLPKHVRLESGNLRSRTNTSSTDETIEYSPSDCVPREIQALAKMRIQQTSFSDTPESERQHTHSSVQKQDSGQTLTTILDKRDNSIDDENASSNSSGSVTISPYKEGGRRRPWMDDVESPIDEHSQIGEPLVLDSDTETLRDSQENTDFRFGLNYENRYQGSYRSELSTPVSSIFDEETDRGFEDALDLHISAGPTVYGGVGLCFESIKEEPEDSTSYGSNPFLNNENDEDVFRTHAVISRGSKSNSRTSSCTSVGDNLFSTSSNIPTRSMYRELAPAPAIVTTDAELDFADSGFTSAHERGYASDSSGQHDVSNKIRTSPWPGDRPMVGISDMTFESNFCVVKSGRLVKEDPAAANTYDRRSEFNNDFSKTDSFATESSVATTSPIFDGRKPYHKAVEAVKQNTRPLPQRVRSFERYTSPVPERRLPKRGHSFETDRSDVKPVYF